MSISFATSSPLQAALTDENPASGFEADAASSPLVS